MGFFKAPHKIHKKVASTVNSAGKKGPHSLVSGSKGNAAAVTPTATRAAPVAGVTRGRSMGTGGNTPAAPVRGAGRAAAMHGGAAPRGRGIPRGGGRP